MQRLRSTDHPSNRQPALGRFQSMATGGFLAFHRTIVATMKDCFGCMTESASSATHWPTDHRAGAGELSERQRRCPRCAHYRRDRSAGAASAPALFWLRKRFKLQPAGEADFKARAAAKLRHRALAIDGPMKPAA